MTRVHLYIDDSGVRRPDHNPKEPDPTGMDYFALGGILIAEDAVGALIQAHDAFMAKWQISAPLHSTRIRGRRGAFAWLGSSGDLGNDFLTDLEALILSLPITTIACVIDRPGYVGRYKDQYKEPWLLCKTAFAILVERAAKFARDKDSNLEIFFEQSGQREDRAIQSYARALELEGMPFNVDASADYQGLRPDDFKSIIIGQPKRVTKAVPMIQIADLVLYPMVKGGYDSSYRPYEKLMESGLIIDAQLALDQRANRGVKYSCFAKK